MLWFFALSGYVIANSLVRNVARNGQIDLVEFAKHRFFRVVPPLLGVLAVLVIFQLLLESFGFTPVSVKHGRDDFHLNWVKVLVSIGTLGAVGDLTGGLDGPLWSLRYEIRCYVTAALVAWLFTKPPKAPLHLIAAICFLSTYWFISLFVRNEGLFSVQAPSLFTFVAGVLVYNQRSNLSAISSFAIAVPCLLLGLSILGNNLHDIDGSASLLMTQCLCGIGLSLGILLLARIDVKSSRLQRLGNMSYTLYILHYPLMLIMYFIILRLAPGSLTEHPGIVAMSGVVGSVSVSGTLAFWLERPEQQRKWWEDVWNKTCYIR